MATVLDYSAGRPGAAAIKAAGHIGAVRYIGWPGRTKCTSTAELDDFTAAGLGMALVYEDHAGDWRGGQLAGQLAGQRARAHATAIGFPASRPIYMAIDQDVVTETDFRAVLAYLGGAAGWLGGIALTGVYGEFDVCTRAAAAGAATWFWQCRAWSGSKLFPSRHLFQRVGSVSVGGVGCDVNEVLQLDWGQHRRDGLVALSDKDADALKWRVEALVAGREKVLNGPTAGEPVAVVQMLNSLSARPVADVDEAALAAELAARGIGGASPADVKAAVQAAIAATRLTVMEPERQP